MIGYYTYILVDWLALEHLMDIGTLYLTRRNNIGCVSADLTLAPPQKTARRSLFSFVYTSVTLRIIMELSPVFKKFGNYYKQHA